MCLAVPAKIIETDGYRGVVEVGGVQLDVNLQLLAEAKTGDFVIVHAGFAIQHLREQEALETLAEFRRLFPELP
jgi:hydrogenase expression/formation protein HypC